MVARILRQWLNQRQLFRIHQYEIETHSLIVFIVLVTETIRFREVLV